MRSWSGTLVRSFCRSLATSLATGLLNAFFSSVRTPGGAVEPEVAGALLHLGRDEAHYGAEGALVVARNEPRPAAVGDDVPESCFLHGFARSAGLRRLII